MSIEAFDFFALEFELDPTFPVPLFFFEAIAGLFLILFL
jgi:hypothetical protein